MECQWDRQAWTSQHSATSFKDTSNIVGNEKWGATWKKKSHKAGIEWNSLDPPTLFVFDGVPRVSHALSDVWFVIKPCKADWREIHPFWSLILEMLEPPTMHFPVSFHTNYLRKDQKEGSYHCRYQKRLKWKEEWWWSWSSRAKLWYFMPFRTAELPQSQIRLIQRHGGVKHDE